MTTPPTPTQELNSWKEIADYLDVTVRTAQRWEEQRGLPVRRLERGQGGVYTTVEELEAWKKSGQLPRTPRIGHPKAAAGPEAPAEVKAAGLGLPVPRMRILGWIALAAVLLASGAAAIHRWFFSPEAPAVWTVQDNTLVVKDIDGQIVWKHIFDERMTESFYRTRDPSLTDPVWIGDLDADGGRETLFVFHGTDRSYLYCFSNRGRVRWKFDPESEVEAGGTPIRGRFNVANFHVGPMGAGRPNSVVVSVVHAGKWPSQIALLSAGGKVERRYWHAGHLGYLRLTLLVADLDGDGAFEICAGGFNAARGQATLVVLDPDLMQGTSQEDVPQYQIGGMAPGGEIARVFIGRSCVQEVAGDVYNFVGEMSFLQDGLRVDTVEAHGTPYLSSILYHLDAQLEMRQIQFSDRYQAAHNRLARDERLNHPFSREMEEKRLRPLFQVIRGSR